MATERIGLPQLVTLQALHDVMSQIKHTIDSTAYDEIVERLDQVEWLAAFGMQRCCQPCPNIPTLFGVRQLPRQKQEIIHVCAEHAPVDGAGTALAGWTLVDIYVTDFKAYPDKNILYHR